MLLAAAESATPNPWFLVPFGLLLVLIALGPLFFPAWWSKHYPKVSIGLGLLTAGYYIVGLHAGGRVLHTAHEYLSFIALIGSLYVVSGGIHINVRGEATPVTNTAYLFVGAVLANVLGTTGASVLLIRPWLRLNKYRVTGHHVVFFILIVSNVGGCLTPIGDPPLYIGYLKGIPFWWVAEHCWPMWAVGVSTLLALFLVVDTLNFRRAPKQVRQEHAAGSDWFQITGGANFILLAVILGAVLFASHPMFLREAILIGAAAVSYRWTPRQVHESNNFTWHPVIEVAVLFIGIFATMMPALDTLATHASSMGQPSPALFYWGTGLLSSLLDNAPTYLCFLQAVFGAYITPDDIQQVQHLIQTSGSDLASFVHGSHSEQIRATFAALQKYHPDHLAARSVSVEEIEVAFLLGNAQYNRFITAISVGAVFFGANTYIGNGPNFMVKAIADEQGVHTPSFLGYVFRYTLPFMIPMLVLVWAIFFR